jgi:hypothetical protein
MIYHTVYRTQNIVNGKYYIGYHKTKNPYDKYLGSGSVFRRAVKKYGEQNFIKNVCFIFDNPEEAFAKEHELIEEYRVDPMCYNLREGGAGGFDWINENGLNGTQWVGVEQRRKAITTRNQRMSSDPEYRARMEKGIRVAKEAWGKLPLEEKSRIVRANYRNWIERNDPETIREVLGRNKRGVANSNHGKGSRFVTNGTIALRVKATDVESYLLRGWVLGKIVKPPKAERLTINQRAPESTNWCAGHKQYLPVAHFHKDSSTPTGYKKFCIECRKSRRKAGDEKRGIHRQPRGWNLKRI